MAIKKHSEVRNEAQRRKVADSKGKATGKNGKGKR